MAPKPKVTVKLNEEQGLIYQKTHPLLKSENMCLLVY